MRIIFDIRPLLERRRAGVSLYTANLLQRLLGMSGHDYTLFGNSSGGRWPDDLPDRSGSVSHALSRYPNRLLNLSLTLFGRPRIEELAGDADLVFMPNLNFAATRLPSVVTVHDLSFVRYPEFFSPKQRLWHRLVRPDRLLRQAAAVVAVSEHTRTDLTETYGVPPERIRVVHPGVSAAYRPMAPEETAEVRQRHGLSGPYLLFLGCLEPRKNVIGIIRAYDRLKAGIDLVIAGGRGWLFKDIFREADRARRRDRIRFLGYVPEADKPALLNGATAFVYPSFYEGFGMPPLEAMACGTPVIASHGSSLGEVVGDAGLLVDPYRTDGLREAMARMLEDGPLRANLRARGLERAHRFGWDDSAKKIDRLFTDLAARRSTDRPFSR